MKISLAHRSFENSRVAVFVSGRGSNLQAMLNDCEQFNVVLVVSNKKFALANLKAKRSGVSVFHFDKSKTWSQLSDELKKYRITLIYLLGFMKLLPENFCHEWAGRMINIHPSLLPHYPGLDSFEKSFEAKDNIGVTLHEVIPEMDAGSILFQKKFRDKNSYESDVSLEKERLALGFTEHRLVRESGKRC